VAQPHVPLITARAEGEHVCAGFKDEGVSKDVVQNALPERDLRATRSELVGRGQVELHTRPPTHRPTGARLSTGMRCWSSWSGSSRRLTAKPTKPPTPSCSGTPCLLKWFRVPVFSSGPCAGSKHVIW
jgi:hypothetical protein